MANKENFAYENPSLDDLRDPFTVDPQFDNRGFHGLDASLEFAAEPIQPRSNLFFREQYPAGSSTSDSLPFMFNTREDVLPTMVGMGGGNFMVYGTSNADRNMSVPNHMSYHNATNGNLSGLNNFMSDYSSDYNLFRGGINSVGSSFTSSTNDSPSSSTPHLIENLVGHWGSDQSGTYSPFGSSCVRNVNEPILGEKLTKKTRMVAEVRPMRPSYSDVLTKSVSNQKPGKPSDGKTKAATSDAKNGKGSKASAYRPSSANGSSGSRQSAGSEDPQKNRSFYLPDLKCIKNLMKFNDDEMKDFVDKGGIEAFCKAFSCKGGGDDNADISGNSVNEDYQKTDTTNNGEVGENVKKSSPKQMPNTKAKDEWDSSQPNKQGGTKPGKKPTNQSEPKEQVPPREKEIPAGIKVEPTGRNRFPEDRKGGSNKTSDSSKLGRRNSRNVQPDRGSKKMGGGRQRRRETGGGWQALVVNQADFVVTNVLRAVQWFVSLVLDVFGLSTNLTLYMCTVFWTSSVTSIAEHYGRVCDWIRGLTILKRISSSRFWPFRRTSGSPPATDDDEDDDDSETDEKGKKKKKKRPPGGLKYNLPLPSTGEEAMKRLLACKGKDPYSILGVSQDCTDDDIKKYYKRQAFLVHPDKNNQPGAEEAFKILVHAFDIIGEPEHRKSYDLRAEKTAQAEHAWSELSDLLAQLHKKMEYVANTLRCTNCGKRHKRTLVARPVYAARMCAQCKIHHSVREGDIWAETSLFGFLWRYFACMDGAVYDITEWAACQGSNLKNLKANTHQVQYRIVLGKQAQKNSRSQQPPSSGDPDLEEFINNLYSKPENGQGGEGMPDSGVRGRKHKRKK